jgi:hypothetical protein
MILLQRSLRAAGALFLVWLPIVACSSAALKPAGTACTSDNQCAAGLSCLPLGAFTEAGCTPAASACSKSCNVDTDCSPLGASFKCFAACNGSLSCGATQ